MNVVALYMRMISVPSYSFFLGASIAPFPPLCYCCRFAVAQKIFVVFKLESAMPRRYILCNVVDWGRDWAIPRGSVVEERRLKPSHPVITPP